MSSARSSAPLSTLAPTSHQVWTPSRGISFGPSPDSRTTHATPAPIAPSPAAAGRPLQPQYPTLEFARLMHNDAATRLHQPTQDGDYASEAEVEPTKATQPATASRLVGASSSKEPVVDDSKETTAGGPVTEAVATAPSRIRATPVSLSWANVFPRPASHPENSLEWTVPDDIFKKAQQAPAGTKESFYSHKLYRGQGRLGKDTPVTVHYCRTAQAAEKVCQQHFADESVIGFDLEWEAGATAWEGARPNVSLIQIATPSRIGLFHVALFPLNTAPLVPPTLRKIIENEEVAKCGVWILGDFARLRKFLRLDPKGALDLSHYHNLITFFKLGKSGPVPRKGVRLAQQVEQALGLPLFKGSDVRQSQWSQKLDIDQIYYSASDAYAGLQLYHVYEHQRKKLRPTPTRPPPAELSRRMHIKQDDGINEDEELAFAGADRRQRAGTVTVEMRMLASKTTQKVARTIETEETDEAFLTTTTTATATITKTTLTTSTPKAAESRPGLSTSIASAPVTTNLATQVLTSPSRPTPTKRKTPGAASRSTPANPRLSDPRVVDADSWAQDFLRSHDSDGPVAQRSSLRAYRIWVQNPDLTLAQIAAMLRDPPLRKRTVAGYIEGAVRVHSMLAPGGGDGLPVDKDRFFNDVISRVGARHASKWLLDALGRDARSLSRWGLDEDDNEIVGKKWNSSNTSAASTTSEADDVEARVSEGEGAGGSDEAGPPQSTNRCSTPTPPEHDMLVALDERLGEGTEKGEDMNMTQNPETWQTLGVPRDETEEEPPPVRSVSPTPSEMEALIEIAGEMD